MRQNYNAEKRRKELKKKKKKEEKLKKKLKRREEERLGIVPGSETSENEDIVNDDSNPESDTNITEN
ncbi:MAG: hypothetical protein JW969_07745 [Spirochaetales bacterium]|nr:hypothetical protein [Spirochaetales bacterium]